MLAAALIRADQSGGSVLHEFENSSGRLTWALVVGQASGLWLSAVYPGARVTLSPVLSDANIFTDARACTSREVIP